MSVFSNIVHPFLSKIDNHQQLDTGWFRISSNLLAVWDKIVQHFRKVGRWLLSKANRCPNVSPIKVSFSVTLNSYLHSNCSGSSLSLMKSEIETQSDTELHTDVCVCPLWSHVLFYYVNTGYDDNPRRWRRKDITKPLTKLLLWHKRPKKLFKFFHTTSERWVCLYCEIFWCSARKSKSSTLLSLKPLQRF